MTTVRPTSRRSAAGVLGELGLAILLALLIPIGLIVLGAPIALLVRGLIELAARF